MQQASQNVLLGLQHSTAVLDELLCCFPTLAYGANLVW